MPSKRQYPDHRLLNGIYKVRNDKWHCDPNYFKSVPELTQPAEDYEVMRQRTVRQYLNFASLPELRANLKILTCQQQNFLLSTLNRIEYYPQRFAREGQQYAATAGVLLMTDALKCKEFCLCGVCGRRCGLWRICPACSHLKRMAILRKYLSKFHHGNLFFCTASFDGLLDFEPPFQEASDLHWAAIEYAVRNMVNEHYFDGAFVFEAFIIHSYFPQILAVPHDHLVIAADSISASSMEVFRDLVRSYQGQVWNPKKRRYEETDRKESVAVQSTSQTFPIESMEDYCNILNYLVVPIDLVTPYHAAWQLVSADQRQLAPLLNQNISEAVTGWQLFSSGRDGHYYRGRFHHKSGGFLGVNKDIRETHQHARHVSALLQDCNDANLGAYPFERNLCIEEKAKRGQSGNEPSSPSEAS